MSRAVPKVKTASPPAVVSAPTDKATAVADAFGEIGRVDATVMPRAQDASSPVAWEYWVSSLLSRLAEARRDRAKKAAVAAAVLPDHVANPLPLGTSETVYADALVTIGVKVVNQADRVNVPALVADLERAGVKPALLKRLVRKHTETFGGAHVFTASLVTA